MTSNIVLIGYMGCGKSSVGKELAISLNKAFIDLDNYIEEKEGMSISNIFEQKGEIYFRKKERQYLQECLIELEDSIISLGGGTPCFGDNMEFVLEDVKSTSVYLKTSIPTLVDRLFNERAKRPIITHTVSKEELAEFVSKHLFERNYYYNRAKCKVITDGKTVNEIVSEVFCIINKNIAL